MPPELAFRNDSHVTYVCKCLVFPSEALEPRFTDITIRTATREDITNAQMYNRTVDLTATFGVNIANCVSGIYHHLKGSRSTILLYFNMSPKLLLNRCI